MGLADRKVKRKIHIYIQCISAMESQRHIIGPHLRVPMNPDLNVYGACLPCVLTSRGGK